MMITLLVLLRIRAEGICLFFHKEDDLRGNDDFRLWSIEVSLAVGAFCLFGVPLSAVDKEAVIDLLNRHLSPVEVKDIKEDLFEAIEESALSVPALKATFYFDQSGILEDLHWGPFFGADGEVIWP